MSFYENKECPVCKKAFEPNDDIVVCPECGTPHHRECYNLIGHCVNKGLHKSGYDYYEENRPIVQSAKTVNEGEYYNPSQDNNNDSSNDKNEQNSGEQFNPFIINAEIGAQYEKDTETIDGEAVSDVAATVRNNVPRFIEKFKKMSTTNKKASWSWGAFFFGPYYLFFRKMYKQGVMFLCAILAVSLGGNIALLNLAPKFSKVYQELISNYYTDSSVTELQTAKSIYNSINTTADGKTAMIILSVCFAIVIILRLIIAIYSDYFYKGTVISIIKTVKEQLNSGSSFIGSPFITDGQSLSQEQLKKMYLARKGGVTFLAPCIVSVALYFIMNVI